MIGSFTLEVVNVWCVNELALDSAFNGFGHHEFVVELLLLEPNLAGDDAQTVSL